MLPETGICETDFIEDGVPCCGTSSVDKPVERKPIEIPVVAAKKSGGCCAPRT
jgi:hypothetical protein